MKTTPTYLLLVDGQLHGYWNPTIALIDLSQQDDVTIFKLSSAKLTTSYSIITKDQLRNDNDIKALAS